MSIRGSCRAAWIKVDGADTCASPCPIRPRNIFPEVEAPARSKYAVATAPEEGGDSLIKEVRYVCSKRSFRGTAVSVAGAEPLLPFPLPLILCSSKRKVSMEAPEV